MCKYSIPWYVTVAKYHGKRNETTFSVGIGCAIGVWFYDMNEGLQTSKVAFILFIGKKNSQTY